METLSRASRTVAHPLDPLAPAEIETAVAIVRRERALGDDVLFVRVLRREPGARRPAACRARARPLRAVKKYPCIDPW
jgi:Cu2+-containing amine oxidase